MALSKVKVLAVAPYEGMRGAILQAAEEFPNILLDTVVGDLEQGVEQVRLKHSERYDAIISRGGTASMIKVIADCPVIEVDITFYDVLRCVKLAQNYTDRFAIVGYPNVTESAHILCDLLGYSTRIITLQNQKDVDAAFAALRREDYRLVLGDMITHTSARAAGFDAFLITSGAESIRTALEQAENSGRIFSQSRQEKHVLRSLLPRKDNSMFVILRKDGSLYTTIPEQIPDELTALCRKQLPELSRTGKPTYFPYKTSTMLHTVSAKAEHIDDRVFYVFHCQPSPIQLKSRQSGIHTMLLPECEQLFMSSFFSTSGAMGELDQRINSIAASRQPVLIMGEPGTGKEQIARLIYLRSRYTGNPLVVVNCRVIEEKGWDYLLGHHNSPLAAYGSTIYFQYLEDMPAARQPELLSIILDMNLTSRAKLVFSCARLEDAAVPEVASTFSFKLGCLTEYLPSLRKRSDEIPSLAVIYLNNLNQELGKEIAGFEPGAMEQLQHYDWPNNYTQFKHILHELATLTSSPYIHSSLVAELLAKERALTRSVPSLNTLSVSIEGRTLDEIIIDTVLQTLSQCGGNQSETARRLGISRSTLWRCLGQCSDVQLAGVKTKKGK